MGDEQLNSIVGKDGLDHFAVQILHFIVSPWWTDHYVERRRMNVRPSTEVYISVVRILHMYVNASAKTETALYS